MLPDANISMRLSFQSTYWQRYSTLINRLAHSVDCATDNIVLSCNFADESDSTMYGIYYSITVYPLKEYYGIPSKRTKKIRNARENEKKPKLEMEH
jgi:hypothetical protein